MGANGKREVSEARWTGPSFAAAAHASAVATTTGRAVMDSRAVLKEALVRLRRTLKGQGFQAKSATFFRHNAEGNTILISAQKSTTSTPRESLVVINYGVYSRVIGARLSGDTSAVIDVAKAHWSRRFGEGGREKWFSVGAADSPDDCAYRLAVAVESLLPELVAHSVDVALLEEWLSGKSPGLTNMQRLLYAAVLLDEIGPFEKLVGIVSELRALVAGTMHQDLVERMLEMANVRTTR